MGHYVAFFCLFYVFALEYQALEPILDLNLRPSCSLPGLLFEARQVLVEQLRKPVPVCLRLIKHLVIYVKFEHLNVLMQSELFVTDARINLVHPFLSALAGCATLATLSIELFRDPSPLVRHPMLTVRGYVLAGHFF